MEYKKLTPFKIQCLTNFPFIDEDFDALSNYGLLCKIVEYMNNIATNNNLLVDNINDLNNWFKNLDVQDEINKKLDEMAESGELTDIIAQYLNLAGLLSYNTVADMKNATNLVNGSTCQTLGFHTINDKGNALYKVRTITNEDTIDEMTLIALNNPLLIAELIIEDEMNVKQFGSYGDGIHDDTLSINTTILNCNTINIPDGIYLIEPSNEQTAENDNDINKGINVTSNKVINFEKNALLKCKTNNYYYYRILRINQSSNIVINNGKIQGDKNTHTGSMDSEFGHCVSILSSNNVVLNNMELYDAMGDGIVLIGLNQSYSPENNCKNITINNCLIHDCRRQGISVIGSYNTKILNCEIYDIRGIKPQSCIDIESNYDDNPVEKVYINNCNLHDSANFNLLIVKGKDILVNNSTIEGILINQNSDKVNINNTIVNDIYSENNLLTTVNNCITNTISLGNDNSKIIVNNSTINKQIHGQLNDTFIQEIICNNSIINNIGNSVSWTFIGGALTTLEFNNCVFNTDTNLSGRKALKTSIKNSKINMLTSDKNGIQSKELIFKNNIITGEKLYYLFTPVNFEKNSFIENNLFETNPDWILRSSENLTQKIYYGNNTSNTVISNIFGGAGSLPNLITYNNNPTS